MNATPVTIIGNLTADPELRYTPGGHAVVNLTVAVNPRTYDRDTQQWKDGDPSFWRVSAWKQLAENCAESLHKGDRVIVYGDIQQTRWTDDKGDHTSWQINAQAVAAELTFANAKVARTSRRHEVDPNDPWVTASSQRPAAADAA